MGTNTPSRTLKGEKTPPAAVRGEGEPPAVRIYFREIGQFGRITPEEEIRLAKRIQSGDAAARQEMILANLRFAVKIALDYEGLGLPRLNLLDKLGREPTNRELGHALGVPRRHAPRLTRLAGRRRVIHPAGRAGFR